MKIFRNQKTNRQIGHLFKHWTNSGALRLESIGIDDFLHTKDNAILNASDSATRHYATEYLGYEREKGLVILLHDLMGRLS